MSNKTFSWLLVGAFVILSFGLVVTAFLAQPRSTKLSVEEQKDLYIKVLERDALANQLAPLQQRLNEMNQELNVRAESLFTKYGVDKTKFDLIPNTGEFREKPPDTTK